MTARILVVEDNALLALELVQALHLAAFQAVGPVRTVVRALEVIEHEGCDAAILDINLGSETSEEVAQELKSRGIPLLIVSGYSEDQHPVVFRGVPAFSKPLRYGAIIQELTQCLKQGALPFDPAV